LANRLTLYTTLGCHLCEQAKPHIFAALLHTDFILEEIDIANDEALVEKYGLLIPVLACQGRELNWPFEQQGVVGLLQPGGQQA